MIGCEDRLRNDLYCVGWGVKLCSTFSKFGVSEPRLTGAVANPDDIVFVALIGDKYEITSIMENVATIRYDTIELRTRTERS